MHYGKTSGQTLASLGRGWPTGQPLATRLKNDLAGHGQLARPGQFSRGLASGQTLATG